MSSYFLKRSWSHQTISDQTQLRPKFGSQQPRWRAILEGAVKKGGEEVNLSKVGYLRSNGVNHVKKSSQIPVTGVQQDLSQLQECQPQFFQDLHEWRVLLLDALGQCLSF